MCIVYKRITFVQVLLYEIWFDFNYIINNLRDLVVDVLFAGVCLHRLEDASNLTTDTGRFNRLTASADHRRRQSASAKTRMIQDQTPQAHAYSTWTCLLCRYRRIWTIAADRSDAALHPTTRTGECTVIRLASTPFQSVHMMGSPRPVRHA